jgi:hypothetical protein
MAKKIKPTVSINLSAQPGAATPAQGHTWRKFWQKLIADVKSDDHKNDNDDGNS